MVNADNKLGALINGRYQIKRVLGKGASSNVYLADDTQFGREVAIKMLTPDENELQLNRRAFETDIETLTVLSHEHNDHIVEIYDVSLGGGDKYIVMEYVPGVTLRAYMDQSRTMKTEEVYNCAEQILLALRIAHKNGIVHRDIKPQNVIVTQSGQLKVTDFGIAKLAHADRFRLKNRAVGTVHYISPEQASGSETDARSDIYSLGVMLYEMVTGRLPFDGATADVIVQKQITENPIPPREIHQSIPAGLEQIILCAMEKDPSDRFRSADAMLAAVNKVRKDPTHIFSSTPAVTDSFQTQEPQSIGSAGGVTTILKTPFRAIGDAAKSKRTRGIIIGAAAGAAALIIGVTVALVTVLGNNGRYVDVRGYFDNVEANFGPLVGSETDALARKMYEDGLNFAGVTYKHSDTVPYGDIISTNVDGLGSVEKYTDINITVSLGKKDYITNDLEGDYETVKDALEATVESALGTPSITYKTTYVSKAGNLNDGQIISWRNEEALPAWYTSVPNKEHYIKTDSTLIFEVASDTFASQIGHEVFEVMSTLRNQGYAPTLKNTNAQIVTKITFQRNAEGGITNVVVE